MNEAWKQWEGQVVNGEFHLRQYLGRGNQSAVFLTEDGKPNLQKAAIKLIPADPMNEELQLSRWRLAAKLSHPHLIRLVQVGRCLLGNVPLLYVVMEYAEENLSQVLAHRPLTPAEARDMLGPVLDALAYIHGEGFVHGHIKPANVMARDDQIKISSDGLCRMGESRGQLGKPGVYDPPDTAGGRLSPAGDVWSLGVTLVEALTQRLPVWESPVWEGMYQGEPVVPQTMPAPFLDLARHSLRLKPQLRWTVAEITARLQQPLPVPPEQRNAQTIARRQRTFAGAIAGAITKKRFIVPTVAVALVVAAMLAGPRLLHRHLETQPSPSNPLEQSGVRPKPPKIPGTLKTQQATQTASVKQQGSSGAIPSPATPQSKAGTNTPASGFVQGEVAEQVLPDVPLKARDTIRGTVRVSVRVRVDTSGSVVGTTLDSPGPSRYFADLASQAARRWDFWPPTVDGRSVASEWLLRFEFERAATRVHPVQTAP